MVLSESVVQWDTRVSMRSGPGVEDDSARWAAFDALTTFGIKLWTPETQEWREVSVKGRAYAPRQRNDTAGERLSIASDGVDSLPGLEITDGSLIDLCGVVVQFQTPSTMARQTPVRMLLLIDNDCTHFQIIATS